MGWGHIVDIQEECFLKIHDAIKLSTSDDEAWREYNHIEEGAFNQGLCALLSEGSESQPELLDILIKAEKSLEYYNLDAMPLVRLPRIDNLCYSVLRRIDSLRAAFFSSTLCSKSDVEEHLLCIWEGFLHDIKSCDADDLYIRLARAIEDDSSKGEGYRAREKRQSPFQMAQEEWGAFTELTNRNRGQLFDAIKQSCDPQEILDLLSRFRTKMENGLIRVRDNVSKCVQSLQKDLDIGKREFQKCAKLRISCESLLVNGIEEKNNMV